MLPSHRSFARRRPCLRLCALAIGWALSSTAASAASLGYYEPWFVPQALSGNGRVAVGGLMGFRNPDGRPSAAFAGDSGSTVSIGLLRPGDDEARAFAANFDGSVIVGASYDCIGTIRRQCVPVAFRWTATGGMVLLPGSTWSEARDVSDDGQIAVGYIVENIPFSVERAVLWRGAGSAEALGLLPGGRWSRAEAISADGRVVVGTAHRPDPVNDNVGEAFRWTQSGGMQGLGKLAGDHGSLANDVSADGNTVVGASFRVSALCCTPTAEQAFRWTASGGMQGLGFLPGHDRSIANAVSGDGSIVVGLSERFGVLDLGSARAIRWTAATGLQSVDTWLAANGVSVPGTVTLLTAYDISRDGSVVLGLARETNSPVGTRDIGWVARVDGNGAGLISDFAAYQRALEGNAALLAQSVSDLSLGSLGGAHRRTLSSRDHDAGTCAWADAALESAADGALRRQRWEAGACRDVGRWRIGLGVAATHTRARLADAGRARIHGWQWALDAGYRFGAHLEAELLATYGDFDLRETRRYANGGGMDASLGKGDGRYDALRARLLAPDLLQAANARFTPYLSIARTRATLRPFAETGGAFPARYGGARWDDTQATFGVQAQWALGKRTRLTPSLEYTRRLDDAESSLAVETIGLFATTLPVQEADRDWAQLALDLDQRLSETATLRLSVFGSDRASGSVGVGMQYAARF